MLYQKILELTSFNENGKCGTAYCEVQLLFGKQDLKLDLNLDLIEQSGVTVQLVGVFHLYKVVYQWEAT